MYVVWSLIHQHGTLEAIRIFEDSLKRITTESGHPDKYNATITHALGFLTAERITAQPDADWDEFTQQNPDLLRWPNQQLTQLYPDDQLHSEQGRKTFILPRP